MPLFLYTKKQYLNFYIYNKNTMAWKLKKEWVGRSIDSINIPLDNLTQKQILSLRESVRNNLFIKESKKKDAKVKK